ncbi:MAG TPA: hypothetical protein VIX85_11570 [Acidimicrobiales bacterium]|jgi:hypothetical protein
MATDWSTIASLGTAVGTLFLGVATFSSVRSANRTAKIAEESLQVGLRPLLVATRPDDRPERVMFMDDRFVTVDGGRAAVEWDGDVVYFVMPIRNVGNGVALLHGWEVIPERLLGVQDRPDPDSFRRQTRDLYIPNGDQGFWQGAMRDSADEMRPAVLEAAKNRTAMTIDLLYGDYEGGQRTISRFGLVPKENGTQWIANVSRHWNLDRADPR